MNQETNKATALLACVLIIIGASITPVPFASQNDEPRSSKSDLTTEWRVSPSFKFDVLCFLNVLTGDSFYLGHYQKEYDHFALLDGKGRPTCLSTSLMTLNRVTVRIRAW